MPLQEQFELAGKESGLQVWRIEKMDLVPVAAALHGQFYKGDCYIVMNTSVSVSPKYEVHAWIGSDSSQDESGAAAIIMTQLDTYLDGVPIQYVEFQGEESDAFCSYFKTGIVYKNGGIASGFLHVVPNEYKEERLLRVRGSKNIMATEMQLSWCSFNSSDCFIVILGLQIYIWCGTSGNRYERLKANELAKGIRDSEMSGRGEIDIIEEGSEPEKLIETLGPKPDLPAEANTEKTDKEDVTTTVAALYLVSDADRSMNVTLVSSQNPFKQDMLSQKDCYILDNGLNKRVFVWKGKQANTEERVKALQQAQAFIKEKGYDPKTHVEIFPSGSEATTFKQFFLNWLDKDETT